MDELVQLQSKYAKIDMTLLKNLLTSQAQVAREIKRNKDQQFNEDEIKINELTLKLNSLKETLSTENEIFESKNNEFLKHNDYLKELETEKKKLLHEIKQLEGNSNSLKSTKPNIQDQQVLEQGQKKLKLYAELTRMHWDYEATMHSIKGYVTNHRDYIHHFCYDSKNINDDLVNSLWHEIYLSVGDKNVAVM